MNVALDLDGVVCDFTSMFVSVINELWPNKLPVGYQPNDWWYTEAMSSFETKEALKAFQAKPDIWCFAPELPGAKALRHYVPKMAEANIGVYFCTARMITGGMGLLQQTKLWLLSHGLLQHYNTSLIVTDSGDKKAQIYAALGLSFSLDDKIETVSDCQAVAGHKAYLLNQPWNSSAVALPRLQSVEEYCSIVLAEQHNRTQRN